MEYTYKYVMSFDGTVSDYSIKRSDNAVIPFDENNTDYVEYLAWLAEGNTPLPVDEEVNNAV